MFIAAFWDKKMLQAFTFTGWKLTGLNQFSVQSPNIFHIPHKKQQVQILQSYSPSCLPKFHKNIIHSMYNTWYKAYQNGFRHELVHSTNFCISLFCIAVISHRDQDKLYRKAFHLASAFKWFQIVAGSWSIS